MNVIKWIAWFICVGSTLSIYYFGKKQHVGFPLALFLLFSVGDGTIIDRLRLFGKKGKPRYKIIQTHRAQVHYELVTTDNPTKTIVVATDPPNCIEHYEKAGVLQQLANDNNARVICLELPGFGFSYPKLNFKFEMDQATEVIEEFLTQMGFGSYILCLPCVSGLSAIQLANKRPDMITHLIFAQTSSFEAEKDWAIRMDIKGAISTKFFGQIFLALMRDSLTKHWLAIAPASKDMQKSLTPIALESHHRGGCFCLASALQKWFYTDNPKLVPPKKTLKQPALVLWGKADRTHRKTDPRGVINYFENPENVIFEEFPSIGHFPDLEQPDVFCDRVRQFLGSFDSKSKL